MIYVTCTDKFMSGWGMAEGLINKLIFLCDTHDEADIVMRNARARDDMKNVSAHIDPPKYFHKNWEETGADYEVGGYYVQIKTKDDYSSWYEADYF